MKTALEEELSEALAQRAVSLPRSAADRLRAIDYHPRRHLLGVPVVISAGAAATAATMGTVLAVVLGGAAPAYAGWSAMPTSSSPPSSAAPDCITTLTNSSSGPSGAAGTSSVAGAWQTLLTDVRGPFTITLLQNGTSYATCFTGPSFTEVNRITTSSNGSGGVQSGSLSVNSQTAGGGVSGPQAGGVGSIVRLEGTTSGDLNQVLQNHLTTTSDGPYTFIDGRVANGVTGVTLALNDGQNVVATVADGWFVAWWPDDTADATSAQVSKPSGTTSENFVPLSQMGTKFPLGGQPSSSSGVSLPPAPGSCTTAITTPGTSGGASVNCKASSSRAGSGAPVSGNSGNSGAGTNSGGSGPGPTSAPKP
jgi:hypothetical protein